MSFSERLKETRKNKGITSKKMAELLGVGVSSYCQYENGKREPNIPKIKAMATILNISADYLIFGNMQTSIKQKELTSDEEELLANYNKLNADGKDKVQDYTKDLTGNKIYTDKLQDKLHA